MIKPVYTSIKLILILLLLGTCIIVSTAQQRFQSSLSWLDKYAENPGYGGMENRLSLTGSYRSQWQGLKGQPDYLRLNAHLPLYSIGGASGFLMRRENIGAISDQSFLLSYNQVFDLGIGGLSVGARAGFLHKSIDGEKLIAAGGEYGDGNIDHNDDYIPETYIAGSAPSWGLGFYFFTNNFDFGMVFDDLPLIALSLDGIAIQKKQSLKVHGSYELEASEYIRLEMFGLLRSDLVQWQVEAGIVTKFSNNLFSSAQIRGYSVNTLDAISVAIGGRLNKNILLAYSYDITLSSLNQVSNGAHELLVRYLVDVQIGKRIPQRIIHSPRLYD
jgi:type IX secretion system PorP/SprF family membrane protein